MSTEPNSATVWWTMSYCLHGVAQVGDDGEGAAADGADLVGDALDVSPPHRLFVFGVGFGGASGSGDGDICAGAG